MLGFAHPPSPALPHSPIPPFASLYNNNVGGTLSSELGELKVLEVLFLDENRMVGMVPPSIAGLTRLKGLDLRGNGFDGEVPFKKEEGVMATRGSV